jgi:hypothetical protein
VPFPSAHSSNLDSFAMIAASSHGLSFLDTVSCLIVWAISFAMISGFFWTSPHDHQRPFAVASFHRRMPVPRSGADSSQWILLAQRIRKMNAKKIPKIKSALIWSRLCLSDLSKIVSSIRHHCRKCRSPGAEHARVGPGDLRGG